MQLSAQQVARELTASMEPSRTETRMSVSMAARLRATGAGTVKATIRNLSTHGARVISERAWNEHDRLLLSDMVGDYSLDAQVVYCERTDGDQFAVGLRFEPRDAH
jgi:hypothetical protein